MIKLAFAIFLVSTSVASAQSFTCGIGRQPSCLDYGDTVCSSLGKCVKSNSICFDSYTCDYNGFVCKSDLTKVVDEYDVVVRKHNHLADAIDDAKRCLNWASSLEEAQECARRLP